MKNTLTSLLKSVAIFLFFTSLIFSSCKKEEGKGGLATIKGKVFGYDVNSAGVVHDSGYVGDVRVYISYGNNTWVDDDVRTSYNGDYAFQGLQTGKYTLSVYSRCDSCSFNQTPVVQEIEITSTRQELSLPDFVIYQ